MRNNIGDNQIEVIPPQIGQLTQLNTLYLHNNKIEVIPPEITQLSRLR